ncbi:MAG: hypothetical protein DDG59_12930 [Anaerolineae bacterium]|jgi:glycosyltransferase involved in cell wall biosynthesis|nr:MAG: hypothetical protein DDG59_12930 [Anaerolineae bacterium]
MKVGFVLPALQKPSGWRSYALGLIGELLDKVEGVLFVPQEEAAAAQQEFPHLGVVPIAATQNASLQSPSGALRLWQTWRSIRSLKVSLDLVHSLEAYPTGLVGHWLAKQCHCPHILTAHGTYGVIWITSFFDRILYRRVLASAARLCPVSQATARRIEQTFGQALKHVPIDVILNGNAYYQRVPDEIAQTRRLPSRPTLLSVGEVKPRKGYHISLQVFERLQKELPEVRYDIVGNCPDNAYTHRLRESIRQKGLAGVRLHGTVSEAELAGFYRQASLFLLTPQEDAGLQKYVFEGFGLVYLEAGAYGLPVIASRCGGVSEAVRHGETGFVFAQDDVDGMAQAALRLLTDEALNRRMGLANRRWAETLTWKRCAEQFWSIYQRCVEGK